MNKSSKQPKEQIDKAKKRPIVNPCDVIADVS